MLKQLAAALLAATALVPALASAQERDDGSREHASRPMQHDGAPRPPRDAGPRGPDRGQAPGNWQQHANPQPNWQRPERAPGQAGNWQQRPDRGSGQPGNWQRQPDNGNGQIGRWQPPPDRDDGRPGGWQQRPDRQPGQSDWRGRRDNNAERVRQQRDWIARSGRGQSWSNWNDHYRDRADFQDRRDWAQGRNWYGDRNGANGGGWNGNRWDGNRGGWNGNHGGGWNRDWRHDRRYDWSAYRGSNRSLYRLPRYYAPYGWHGGYRRFSTGVTLDSLLFAQSYWIDDPWSYRLPPAEGPYRWVRYYNDALLVDVDSGEVVDTIYDIFW